MRKGITATQAVRDFSELLNKIRFRGDSYVIERSGKPVAQMEPVRDAKKVKILKELQSLLKELPGLDEELDAFAADRHEGDQSWRSKQRNSGPRRDGEKSGNAQERKDRHCRPLMLLKISIKGTLRGFALGKSICVYTHLHLT